MRTFRFLLIVVFVCISVSSFGRKVVCIDGDNSGYCNNREGWENNNKRPGDVIVVGGNLTDCMNMVNDGDTLIIVCHGKRDTVNGNTGFCWGGNVYWEFGDDSLQMPVPEKFDSIQNVFVEFAACYSDSIYSGDTTSVLDRLLEKMGTALTGGGNSGKGYTHEAESGSIICFTAKNKGVRNQAKALLETEANYNYIADNPPPNRVPPVVPNQKTAAQHLLDSLLGPGKVTVDSIKFTPPTHHIPAIPSSCDCHPTHGCGYAPMVIDGVSIKPTNFSATVTSSSTTLFNWDVMPHAGYYRIRYRPVGSTSPYFLLNSNTNSYNLINMIPGQDYTAQVRTVSTSGLNSSWSDAQVFVLDSTCVAPPATFEAVVAPTFAVLAWNPPPTPPSDFKVQYKKLSGGPWIKLTVPGNQNNVQIMPLLPNTAYRWKMRTKCGPEFSNFTEERIFNTPPLANRYADSPSIFTVYPNPCKDGIQVLLNHDVPVTEVCIYDASGRKLLHMIPAANETELHFDLSDFKQGVYFIKVFSDSGEISFEKIVKL